MYLVYQFCNKGDLGVYVGDFGKLTEHQVSKFQDSRLFFDVYHTFFTHYSIDPRLCEANVRGNVCAEKAPKALEIFDAQLANNAYLAGDRFSIADITLGVAVDFAEMVKVVPIPELANMARWRAEISSRPSFSAS